MINSILVERNEENKEFLNSRIRQYCPQVNIRGSVNTVNFARDLIADVQPDLLFLDINIPPLSSGFKLLEEYSGFEFETIIISNVDQQALKALQYSVSGYILRPIQPDALQIAVSNAQQRIQIKRENRKNQLLVEKLLKQTSEDQIIGFPTIDGFDFYPVKEIIRCEGLQRCTRIVTKSRSNIISSYNLGEFNKLLKPYGFFSSHRSHLINLKLVKKYNREGTIIMVDDSLVPVAKRKKSEFLDSIVHL
jgi:two-component system LytT family response regulator